jgi:RNA polymerase sigma-70 factor (ECF subfamily)
MTADTDPRIADARHDPERLGVLLETYRHYLRLLARVEIGKRLQGKIDASDVVQEAFLDAHRHFPAFRGHAEAQFAAWLREILAGTLSNQVRRFFGTQARDPRLEVNAADLDQSSYGLAQMLIDPGTSPSGHADRREQSLRVAEALGRLPDDYQTVLVLRHLEGLTFPEVARAMGKSVDSVEKLWLRGLTRLKKAFAADGGTA